MKTTRPAIMQFRFLLQHHFMCDCYIAATASVLKKWEDTVFEVKNPRPWSGFDFRAIVFSMKWQVL